MIFAHGIDWDQAAVANGGSPSSVTMWMQFWYTWVTCNHLQEMLVTRNGIMQRESLVAPAREAANPRKRPNGTLEIQSRKRQKQCAPWVQKNTIEIDWLTTQQATHQSDPGSALQPPKRLSSHPWSGGGAWNTRRDWSGFGGKTAGSWGNLQRKDWFVIMQLT